MEPVRIDHIDLFHIRLPLVHFFETSFGRTRQRDVILVRARGEENDGWGECVAGEGPFYSSECVHTAWPVLGTFLIPLLLERAPLRPAEILEILSPVRGHSMAKSALEAAVWDLAARREGRPLWKLIGGTRASIPCGVSIGIQDSLDDLLAKIEKELAAGYRKIKIKIKPGWDVEVAQQVRQRYPDISLMVDANSAYRPEDAEHLARLDGLDLLMIEQPLYYDDIYLHSALQKQLQTPICLDESIRHCRDVDMALDLEACRIINIKMGRVGGLSEAIRIHDVCRNRGVPVWCGGMLETGIGRAHNIALSTLENFSLPGDVSASKRYFRRDTIQRPVEVDSEGFISAPEGPGIGYEADVDWIRENTQQSATFRREDIV